VNVENKADLDLFYEAPSGLILTAEELLRVHGGSCVASYHDTNGGSSSSGGGGRGPTVNGEGKDPSPEIENMTGGMTGPLKGK
jgi:hypothetical protein